MRWLSLLGVLLAVAPAFAQEKNQSSSIDYAQAAPSQRGTDEFAAYRKGVAKGAIGTYADPPRNDAGKVDIPRLVAELKDIRANTYHWLIGNGDGDYEDLKKFLPEAAKQRLNVWVTILPPSEARTRPVYCVNYQRWARELATLSLEHPNLVAWSIDDFGHNQEFYSSYYMGLFIPEARKINPKLAFVPCVYYGQSTEAFVRKYGQFMDGVLFPFRNESGKADLKTASSAISEIKRMKELYGDMPLVLDVYASGHSTLGQSTPEYVDEVVTAGFKAADGVLIFRHQNPTLRPEKYAILKKHFMLGFPVASE